MEWRVVAFLDHALLEARSIHEARIHKTGNNRRTADSSLCFERRSKVLSLATKCALQESLDAKTDREGTGTREEEWITSYSISIANKTTTNVESQVGLLYLTPLLSFADQACEDLHTPGLRARRSC